MPVKFRCPGCRQAYSISSKKAGTSLTCQKCGVQIRVPEVGAAEASDKPDQKAGPSSRAGTSKAPAAERGDADLFKGVGRKKPDVEIDFRSADLMSSEPEDDFDDAAGHQRRPAPDVLNEDDLPPPDDADSGLGRKSSMGDDGRSDRRSGQSDAGSAVEVNPADGEDDLEAVLAFEQALEAHEGPSPASQLPLPDELFADDEDEEDEERGSRAGEDEEMDLTPMVDVTFLLLIFFMITASFSIQKTLEVPNPDPDEKGASTSMTIKEIEETSVEINIDERNVISVDDEPIGDPSRLPDKLRATRMTEVLITAHENATHELVVKCVDAANEVGMLKIRMGITR